MSTLYTGSICGTLVALSERNGIWACRRYTGSGEFGPGRGSPSETVLDAIATLASESPSSLNAYAEELRYLVDDIKKTGFDKHIDMTRALELLSLVRPVECPTDLPALQRRLLRHLGVSKEKCALFERRDGRTETTEYLLVEAFPGSLGSSLEDSSFNGCKLSCVRANPRPPANGTVEHRLVAKLPRLKSPDKSDDYWFQARLDKAMAEKFHSDKNQLVEFLTHDKSRVSPVWGWKEAAQAAVDEAIANRSSRVILYGISEETIRPYARIRGIELDFQSPGVILDWRETKH